MFSRVLEIFKQLCKIPHGSGNTQYISDFCTDFAASLSLRYIRDNAGNVIIFKGGTDGYELCPTVIIQGHLDMVAVKNADCKINMETDGLDIKEDENFLWADGTSLGGDDGIAVAYALALAESTDIPHPPLEIVLTTDEEIGMDGAKALDTSVLNGHTLINLDSECEGEILAGCAGGARAHDEFLCSFYNYSSCAVKVSLSGFAGGHSGTEIANGGLNAIIALSKAIKCTDGTRICEIRGGSADNSIASFCSAVVCLKNENSKKVIEDYFDKQIKPVEKSAVLTFENVTASKAMNEADSERLLNFISTVPNAVVSYNEEIPTLVSTSLNLGTIQTTESGVLLCHALRSDSEEKKTALKKELSRHGEKYGVKISYGAEYGAWEYAKESKIRDLFKITYRELFGKEMKVNVIHAGLECGIFSSKIRPLDCVSLGPNIYDIHTTKEKLDKKSAERVFALLTAVLKKID